MARLTTEQYNAMQQGTDTKKKPKNKLVAKQKKEAEKAKFEADIKAYLGDFVAEYKFHPTRKWRFDYVLRNAPIALELNGGAWQRNSNGTTGGRHTHGSGYAKDLEKLNHAQLQGFIVFQFTYDCIRKGRHLAIFEQAKEVIAKYEKLNNAGKTENTAKDM